MFGKHDIVSKPFLKAAKLPQILTRIYAKTRAFALPKWLISKIRVFVLLKVKKTTVSLIS